VNALHQLEGQTVLSGIRLDALTGVDDCIATFRATAADGSVCTVRVSLSLAVGEHQESSLQAAFTRMARHAVGIRALAPPRAAGAVNVDGVPRLAIAHAGDPSPSAEERLSEGRATSIDAVVALLEPVAQALGSLHDQGIVHGAVHPAALRLDPIGATLSAFGWSELATVLGGPAGARDVVPVRNRAPEQVGPVPASPSPESDTYGMALVALELLAGRPCPAPGETAEFPTPRACGLDLPDAIASALDEALRPGPRDRLGDPRAFLRRLSEARFAPEPSDGPVPAPTATPTPVPAPPAPEKTSGFEPPPPIPTVPKPSQPYPPPPPDPAKNRSADWFVYVFVGLGLLLLIGGVVAVFYYVIDSPSRTTTVTNSPPTPPPPTVLTPPPPPTTPPPTVPTVPTTPTPTPDASEPPDGDTPEEAGAPPRSRPWPVPATADAAYPEDAAALVPVAPDTVVVGSRDAQVTMVLFADMRCPYTRRARLAVERLVSQYPSELRVSVRHLPLSEQPASGEAAEIAAGALALHGPKTFWDVFEKLTENPSDHERDSLLGWARDAGADETKLRAALGSGAYRATVERDVNLAGQLMVRATPTFFVNGIRLNGMQPQATLSDAVETERLAALGSGVKPASRYASRVLFNVTSAAADRRGPTP
jgi:protein-disulfide isomerase